MYPAGAPFPIVISSEVGERELLALNRTVYKNRRIAVIVIYSILLGTLILTQAILFALTREIMPFTAACSAFLLLVLLYELFLFPLVVRTIVRKQLAKLGVQQVTTEIYGDCLVEHTVSKSGASDQRFQYAALVKAVETEDYFFLYMTKLSAFILDKRRMTFDQAAVIRNLLTSALPGRYKIQ